MTNEGIKDVWLRLQGYLEQSETITSKIMDSDLWNQFNNDIDSLIEITQNEKYNSFKLIPKTMQAFSRGSFFEYVNADVYKSRLNALINQLGGNPYTKKSSTTGEIKYINNISQFQTQSQEMRIEMILELQSNIDKKIQELPDGKEKTFLEKIKTSLSSVKDYVGLLKLVLTVGSDVGLTITQILALFN